VTFSVGVVEAGYVGLVRVTGACPLTSGPESCVDKNEKQLEC